LIHINTTDIGTADGIKRVHLVFAVLERALFASRKVPGERLRDRLAEIRP
jgi:hypothetical protein